MPGIPVQITFQGGGAKIALLLAAADAIRELETAEVIKVSRIAGTSAGAIVGAFLAVGADLPQIRSELSGKVGQELLSAYQMPGTLNLFSKIARGARFWSDAPLQAWLRKHFAKFDSLAGHAACFDDLPKHARPCLTVVATNLSTGKRYEPSGQADIVGALLASAGLPFCFRTWKAGGNEILVDGGICKNLPVESLLKHQVTDGPVVAFSFAPVKPMVPDGPLQFGMALLDAAINDSVESAKMQLGEHAVCTLGHEQLGITTFAFDRARAFLSSDEYTIVKTHVRQWFEALAAREHRKAERQAKGEITEDLWRRPVSDESRRQMMAIGRVYHSSHSAQKFRYHRMRITAVANCLAAKTHPGYGRPDDVIYEFEFEPTTGPLVAHRLTLSSSAGDPFIDGYNLEFWSLADNGAKIESLAAVIPGSDMMRELVTFFVPALAPNTGRYMMRLTDQGRDLFKKFLNPQDPEEFIDLALERAEGTIDKVEFLLRVPREFRHVSLSGANEDGLKEMSPAAIKSCVSAESNYHTYGWHCTNLPARPWVRASFRV